MGSGLRLFMKSLRLVPPLIAKRTFSNCLWEGPDDCGMLALTFDDGPDPAVTPAVLDALDYTSATGTFFMNGERVREHSKLALQVSERGHVIGNHGMTHGRMLFMRQEKAAREIDRAQKLITDATGITPRFFRPPYGHFSGGVSRAVRERGLVMTLWTVLSGDFGEHNPDTVYETVLPYIRSGAVIVFHDTTAGGGALLPGLIERIGATARNRDLRLAGIDEIADAALGNGQP